MSGLILVSHNLSRPATLSALYDSILSRRGGLWVSWDGTAGEAAAQTARVLTFRNGHRFDTLSFPLTHDEIEQGLHNYVHQGLWPVFHQRPDLARFSQESLSQYRNISQAYASAICEYAMPDDVIWIQDYHLIPSVKLLRDAGLTNRIGFFFHQPFPAGQGFCAIPDWQWLAESLCCCDLIGFQTVQDMNNFQLWLHSAFRSERLSASRCRVHGRIISMGVYPVGIDLEDAHCLQESNSCRYMEQQCRHTLPENTILSGGHLDDSAGLPWRISALEVLMRRHPGYAGNIMLLQLASPAAGYAPQTAGQNPAESLSNAINSADWRAISYLTKSYSREEQAGIYRASRVALVTPLMAGMSLMAKMYVAMQDPTNPGVLILSQFSGASEHMDGALIVNPYDPDDIADAIHTALRIPLSERQNRHARLMKGIYHQDCHWWAGHFLQDLCHSDAAAGSAAGGLMLSYGVSGRARY